MEMADEEFPGDSILVIRGPGLTLGEYRNATSGIGPLAHEWDDKPHRLVFDLINEVKRLNEELELAQEDSKRLRRYIARDTACDDGLGKLARNK
jgi:hypothetical protein